jgi:hypothetical protein
MFYDAFQQIGGRFHVLEQRVPVEDQIEYLKYSHNVRKRRRKKLDEKEFERFGEKLDSADLSKDEKKKILTLLASSSEIGAYRLLEKYVQHPDEELVHWASMALLESRIAIESELSGERQIYISTGLGGKGEKRRFYVMLHASQEMPFADYQRDVVEKEFEYILPDFDCEIERLTIYDNYVELVLLIPIATDIKKALETVIKECNVYGNFLSKMITLTNVKELDQDEVNQVLNKYREQ